MTRETITHVILKLRGVEDPEDLIQWAHHIVALDTLPMADLLEELSLEVRDAISTMQPATPSPISANPGGEEAGTENAKG